MGNAILNWQDGVARVVNNRGLYARLLGRFAETQATTVTDIQNAINAGDTEEARNLVHTVKGTAANLGAEALAEAALQLEQAIKGGADTVTPLACLAKTLEETLTAMKSFQA